MRRWRNGGDNDTPLRVCAAARRRRAVVGLIVVVVVVVVVIVVVVVVRTPLACPRRRRRSSSSRSATATTPSPSSTAAAASAATAAVACRAHNRHRARLRQTRRRIIAQRRPQATQHITPIVDGQVLVHEREHRQALASAASSALANGNEFRVFLVRVPKASRKVSDVVVQDLRGEDQAEHMSAQAMAVQ